MSREDHAKYFFLSEWTLANSGFLKRLRKISPKFALTFKTLASRKSQDILSNFCGLLLRKYEMDSGALKLQPLLKAV